MIDKKTGPRNQGVWPQLVKRDFKLEIESIFH